MRNRYLVPIVPEPGAAVPVAGDEYHHAARVARVRIGEEIELFDGKGANVVAAVETMDHNVLVARVVRNVDERRELPIELTVAIAIIQLEKLELVLQKGTELGASRFVPFFADRTEIRRERVAGKLERWHKIVVEATKQCGRSIIPAVDKPVDFREVLTLPAPRVLYDADSAESAGSLDELAKEKLLTLLIGPEGGWSDAELSAAAASQCLIRHLGRRRLRAETAAIAAIAEISLFVDRMSSRASV